MVIIKDKSGNKVSVRALCDSGSQLNLISSNLVQYLKLQGTPSQMRVHGFGGVMPTKYKISTQVYSTLDSNVCIDIDLFVAPKLLGILPQATIDIGKWPHIERLKLADEKFNVPSSVDMILGADFYSKIVTEGIIRMPKSPTAQNTLFGWIIFGEVGLPVSCNIVAAAATINDDKILNLLTRFWELETVDQRYHRTPE